MGGNFISFRKAAFLAVSLLMVSGAAAQPLMLRVSPNAGGAGPGAVTSFGYTSEGWLKVPVQELHRFGPNYAQSSGVTVRPGSQIPEWVETADMQSISIPRLNSGSYYVYFISPDRKVVVMEPDTRRVMRVIRE